VRSTMSLIYTERRCVCTETNENDFISVHLALEVCHIPKLVFVKMFVFIFVPLCYSNTSTSDTNKNNKRCNAAVD